MSKRTIKVFQRCVVVICNRSYNASKSGPTKTVLVESNINVVPRIKKVVSGSTITGVIEATVNGPKDLTKDVFCSEVRFCPVLDLIDIKTFPYDGVDVTPKDESKLPSSPPHTETACVFGKVF